MKPQVRNTLKIALGETNVREVGGNNRGARVAQFQASTGNHPGDAWCASFVYWCIKSATPPGKFPPFIASGGCPDIHAWAKRRAILVRDPEPGDAFLRYDSNGVKTWAGHVGFVTKVDATYFWTVEGNTAPAQGGQEGVWQKRHLRSGPYRFVRWSALIEEEDPSTGAPAPVLPYALFIDGNKIDDMPVIDGSSYLKLREWVAHTGDVLTWDEVYRRPLVNGHPLPMRIILMDGYSYAPLNFLIQGRGFDSVVDNKARTVNLKAKSRV